MRGETVSDLERLVQNLLVDTLFTPGLWTKLLSAPILLHMNDNASVFPEGSIVTVSDPSGKDSHDYRGLRARVIGVSVRQIGPGAVHRVAFLDAGLPIEEQYFDSEELSATTEAE